MSRLFFVILFVLSVGVRTTSSVGSWRSILRAIDEKTDNAVDHPVVGVELNATDFDSVLRGTLATHAIVEFFAHWCPACRNYKPHYERVARLFNGPGAVHPGIILMTRVDCALKINTKLCDKFSVGHYPMLFWGPPSKFVGGSWKPQQEKGDISVIDDGRTADRLLNWINKKIGSSYGLDDQKFEGSHVSANASDLEQIVRALYDVEEATSTAFDIIVSHKMIKSDTRAALITFLQLLVAHHPSWRCRKGSAGILVNFDDLYPSDPLSSNEKDSTGPQGGLVDNFQVCGKEVPHGYWVFCRGSRNETRGFSCGLWLLLHSLSVRIENEESQFAFRTTCDFIHNFFVCEECREHFYEMCSSVTSPFTKSRDFAIWLWDAHNKVNERLMKEEASLDTGDPKFPKIIWPPEQLCPSCFISQSRKRNPANRIEWDHDEVFKFLRGYYGVKLMSLYKDKGVVRGGIKLMAGGGTGGDADDTAVSTHAVVVPVGAALAIAFASCAFGVLAWFWRSQQKNRKYPHHLHSFKET